MGSHAQSTQPQWATTGNTARTPANRERKQPQSSADRGCHKAGDRSRTDDVQLGKLTGPNSNHLENKGDTNSPLTVVPKMVPCEEENGTESASPHADQLAIIANLWPSLPQVVRTTIIHLARSSSEATDVELRIPDATRKTDE
jgi:hypothetical protein